MKKWLSILCSLCLISTLLINPYVFAAGDDNATKAVIFNGDQYVTDVEMRTPSGTVIENNGILEVGKTYDLDYQWNLPDNTFEKGDVLNFSIPKEFIIVNQFDFTLSNDGEEVAKAKVLGNKDSYYYIQMTFTTDYISTHSDVSGEFNLQYRLNEKYVKEGSNEIQIPPGEIITVVVPPFETGGGGGGEGAGHPNNSLKNGSVKDVTMKNPETGVFDIPTRIMTWEIGLGRNVLLGKASSFDEISSITVEDEPIDQEIIAVYSFDKSWPDTFAFSKGFFDKSSFSIDSIKENDMGLKRNPTGGYYESFKTEILPQVKEYEEYAQNKGDAFREYALEYSTLPLDEVIEEREFKNKAKITVKYKDDKYPPNSWVLEKKVEWNVGSGSITGKTANVEMKKVDEQSRGLQGAVFDLYKQSRSGEYTKYKENITSNSNGIVRAEKLTTGNYYFQEVKPPTGYELTNERLSFIIETKDLGTTQVKNVGQLKNGSEKTSVSVEKKWDDKNNQDGKRPDIVKVQLYGDGEKVGPVEELAEGDNWSHTWTDLPLLKNGKEIRYTVQEVEIPPDYTLTQTSPNKNQFLFTNKNIPEEVEVSGEKKWNDNNNQDGKRPNEVIVQLYADNEKVQTQTTNAARNWKYSFTKLPKYKDGELIEYTIVEEKVPGYSSSIVEKPLNNQNIKTIDITNSYTPGKTLLSVFKVWDDNNNQDNKRPPSIEVELLGNGKPTGKKEILNQSNNWTAEFTDLDEKENGQVIKYTVKEAAVDGYDVTYIEGTPSTSIILTNKYSPESTSISGTKTWDDANNQDGKRPQSIQINLLANNILVDQKVVTSAEGWKYEFKNLPKYENGKEIVYTVKEEPVPGYTSQQNGNNFTNSYKPEETAVYGTKTWNDNNNQDQLRPVKIVVELMKNGVATNNKKDVFAPWNYSFTGLPKYENGKEIKYTVREETVNGYNPTINGMDIVNIHRPDEVTIQGEKVWDDANNQDGVRPSEVRVYLYADGFIAGQVLTNETKNWRYEFAGLPKFDNGKLIIYTVKEEPVPKYDTEINGYTITNKHIPEVTSINGKKTWDDNNNQDGKRPNSIEVELYADGQATGKRETATSPNWTYEFTNLAKYKNGKEIKYTVKERNIPAGYTSTVNGMNMTNVYKPEKVNVKGQKKWDDGNNQDGIRPNQIKVYLYANVSALENYSVKDKNLMDTIKVSELGESLVKNSKSGEVQNRIMSLSPKDNESNLLEYKVDEQIVTAANNWRYEFNDLPKYENGQLIEYSVREEPVPKYETTVDDATYTITNKYVPETIELEGTKKWIDNNDQDGLRPKQVTVILYADGKEYERQNVSEGDNWTYKFTELPKNNQGKEIVYTVKEVPIPGYTLKVDDTTLTNSHTPSEIDIVGEKKWNDANDQDGQRPEKIYVNLLADGQQIERQVVTAANNWKYEFRNLPEYQNGKKIVYNVTEDEISEYSTVVDDSKLDSVKITNSYTPKKTSRSIIKLWNDEEDQDGKRPTSIQVQLYANAEKQGPAVTLDESNNWEYTWLDLDERKGGKPIVYTAKEVGTPKDYTVTVNEETPGTFIMKNYHKPETVEVKGEKRWDDANNQDGVRPEAIKVNLIADGELMAEKIVTSETGWKYTFTDLPKYKNQGQLIEYKVTEEVIAEYSTEIEGTTINNKHTPYKTSRTVMKFFEDAQNQDGTRPTEITVQLYGDDEKVSEPVLLNEENEWKHTWEDLDERKAGKKIRYTVKEVNTPIGYEVIVDHETTPGMILVTNKHVPEEVELKGEKKWADDGNRDRKRPGKIKVHLFADGKEIQEKTVTEKEDWAYEFTGLPKYRDGGEEIVYTITEDSVPNYTTEIEGMDITNSYTPGKTSVTVTKTWDDQNDLEGKRPDDIRVQLYANDKKEGTTITLNEKNKWTHTWQDLNQNADGKPIKYTVKEVTELKDYEVSVDVENKGNIVITNRLIETPPEEEPPFDGGEEFEPPSSGNEEFEVDGPSNLGTLSPNGNSFQNVPYEIERPIQKENLPKTGEKTNPWYIVVGVILCLLAIFFIFRNLRHKKQNR